MANHFFSINRGTDSAKSSIVTTGAASTAGDDLELRIADASSLTKKEVVVLTQRLIDYIRAQSNFPNL